MLQASDVPKNQRLRYIQEVFNENNIDAQQAELAEIINDDRAKTGNINKIYKGTLGVSDSIFEVFLQHYPIPPRWWEEQKPMPSGSVTRTLKDYVELLERRDKEKEADKIFYQNLLKTSLVTIATNLTYLSKKFLNGESNTGGDIFHDPDDKPPV